jgi:hypothetical protein
VEERDKEKKEWSLYAAIFFFNPPSIPHGKNLLFLLGGFNHKREKKKRKDEREREQDSVYRWEEGEKRGKARI